MSTDTLVKEEATTATATTTTTQSKEEVLDSKEESSVNSTSIDAKEASTVVNEESTSSDSSSSDKTVLSEEESQYNQKLLEKIEARSKEAYDDLIQFEQRNNYNINATTLLQAKKRSCLLESDHENLNFLFEYIVYLKKRKKIAESK